MDQEPLAVPEGLGDYASRLFAGWLQGVIQVDGTITTAAWNRAVSEAAACQERMRIRAAQVGQGTRP